MAYYSESDFSWLSDFVTGGSFSETDANQLDQNAERTHRNIVDYIIGNDHAPTRNMDTLHANLGTAETNVLNLFLAGSRLKYGMDISNNGSDSNNDIDITAGTCVDATGVTFMTGGAMTKRLDASWIAGTNQGGLFSGSKANSTWYAVFAIKKDSDSSIDYGFDTSVTAANKPTGYTYYRRIGYIMTDGSGNILQFFKIGNRFYLKTRIQNVAATNPGTSAVLSAVTVPPGLLGILNISLGTSYITARVYALFTSPNETDSTPSISLFDVSAREQYGTSGYEDWNSVEKVIQVNSSSQMRYRLSFSDATCYVYIHTCGWIDTGLLG